MPTTYSVIRRPLITEKGLGVKETQNTLVFEVAPKAKKTKTKKAAVLDEDEDEEEDEDEPQAVAAAPPAEWGSCLTNPYR